MKLNVLDSNGFYKEDHVQGDMPENWTADLVGSGYYKAQYQGATRNPETGEWSGGRWVETGEAPPIDYLQLAKSQQSSLMREATLAIVPLQDAVDLDDATDEEMALLRKWKQYRVALNRLDLSTAPDIDWPVKPE